MTTYNTGNPVPSADARDRYDNSQTFDLVINSQEYEADTRTGEKIKTLAWMRDAALAIPAIEAAQRSEEAEARSKAAADTAVSSAATATSKADRAMSEASRSAYEASQALLYSQAALANGQIKTTVAAGLATGLEYFWVASTDLLNVVTLYQNVSGAAVNRGSHPSSAAIKAVLQLIKPNGSADIYWNVNDVSGAMLSYFSADKFRLPMLECSKTSDGSFSIQDASGGIAIHASASQFIGGPIQAKYVDIPGVYVVNEKGDVLSDLSSNDGDGDGDVEAIAPLQDGVVFAPTLATYSGYSTKIYAQSLLPRRTQYKDVVASVASTTTDESASGDVIEVQGSKLGTVALMNIRERLNPSSRLFVPLKVASVPAQTGSPAISVLLIGDSVSNRQGAQYIRQYLIEMGFNPTFLGTVNGSANAASKGNATGPLGECREGWESSDFTNYANDRGILIEDSPAGVAAYLALTKNEKMDRNPFLREATSSDPSDIIENGRVFDAVFYKNRFDIADPDIIINLLGTNDIRKRSGSVIYGIMTRAERIMHSQLHAAWPNAKILRSVPGTPYNNERNEIWESRYVPAIKAMRDSIRTLANSRTILMPAWAFTNPDVGYAQSGTPGDDFSYKSDWTDPLHPLGASKISLFKSIAPYAAAAKLNLI